jgi:superoxide reductase
MKARRKFLRGSLILAGASLTGSAVGAEAETKFPAGLIYTRTSTGRWAGKENTHAPKVTVDGKNVTIVTPHPMTEKHYIVKHTLVTSKGKFLGEKTFYNTDSSAESSYVLPDDVKGTLWATSFCNIHDFWITTFKV